MLNLFFASIIKMKQPAGVSRRGPVFDPQKRSVCESERGQTGKGLTIGSPSDCVRLKPSSEPNTGSGWTAKGRLSVSQNIGAAVREGR